MAIFDNLDDQVKTYYNEASRKDKTKLINDGVERKTSGELVFNPSAPTVVMVHTFMKKKFWTKQAGGVYMCFQYKSEVNIAMSIRILATLACISNHLYLLLFPTFESGAAYFSQILRIHRFLLYACVHTHVFVNLRCHQGGRGHKMWG